MVGSMPRLRLSIRSSSILVLGSQILICPSVQVRSKLFGRQEAKYSNYTCYSGLTNFVPRYINTVGYVIWQLVMWKNIFIESTNLMLIDKAR